MVVIGVDGANAAVRKQDILTVGMVGAKAEFRFDDKWDELGKTAVFRQGNVTKDAAVFDGTVTIPWEVLQLAGAPVHIGVYGTNKEGTIVIPTVWVKTTPVQAGADPSGDESADPALPVWAQMQARLDAMYQSTEQIDAAKEELLQAIDEAEKQITFGAGAKFASAITGEMSGDIVAASDVSPVEHFLSVKVRGKNLFDNVDDFVKESGTVHTFVDGVLTISGGYALKWVKIEEGKTYSFSSVSERLGDTGGGIYIRAYNAGKTSYRVIKYDANTLSPNCTFTTEKGDAYLRVVFYGSTKSNAEDTAIYSNIQLEEGPVITEYVPYISPADASVVRCSKNLIKYPFSFASRTVNGVTFTPDADGTVFVKGTATANTYFALNGGFNSDAHPIPASLKVGKEYTITDAMLFLYVAGGTKAFSAGTFVMPEGYDYFGIFIYVPAGTTIETILKPQLELGEDATEFAPCAGESYVAAADGTVEGVTSLAPGMTLYTETPGMLLDVKYNRDTNAVIADLLEKMFPAARITSVSLPASKWTGSGSLYSQVVSIPGVTENSQVNLTPSVEQLSIFYEKDLTFITENDGGVVTVYVIGQKPQNDYTIQADVVEVTT